MYAPSSTALAQQLVDALLVVCSSAAALVLVNDALACSSSPQHQGAAVNRLRHASTTDSSRAGQRGSHIGFKFQLAAAFEVPLQAPPPTAAAATADA